MFSARTEWDFRPTDLTAHLADLRARGVEVIDLTESNPTRCGFDYHPHLTLDPLSTRRSLVYEPHPKGILLARRAIADFYAHQGIKVDPERIFLTAGTSEAYTFLFRLLCNGRDSVILPKPGYPLLDYLCQINDVLPRHVHLRREEGWKYDLELISVELAARSKALVLIHPNNPTGSYVRSPEREQICAMVSASHSALIVDEVFHAFDLSKNTPAPSFASTDECLTFTLNGISKLLGLPQLKLAWIVVSGPPEEIEDALRRLEVIGDLFLSVSTPVQQALPVLLQDPAGMMEQIRSRLRKNALRLTELSNSHPAIEVALPEGGWHALITLPLARSAHDWSLHLLDVHQTLVHPGELFDFEEEGIVVVSLLQKQDIFEEGIERIADAVAV
jgi:aspartate/methionine/tyrosine aminotransferase